MGRKSIKVLKNPIVVVCALILSFLAGIGADRSYLYEAKNGTIVQSEVKQIAAADTMDRAKLFFSIEKHMHGIATFDSITLLALQNDNLIPFETEKSEVVIKKKSVVKETKKVVADNKKYGKKSYSENQKVSIFKNKLLKTNDVLKNVTLVVDSMFQDQQLWVSDNADTIFVSTEKYSLWHLERAVELKKQHLGKKEAVYAEGTGTCYRSTIEDCDLGKTRIELLTLFTVGRTINNQKEHLFYHDSTGFGVYGQIFPNGDTVILRIDTLDHIVPNSLMSQHQTSLVIDTNKVEMQDVVNHTNVDVELNETIVTDDANKTEDFSKIEQSKEKKDKKESKKNKVVKKHKVKKEQTIKYKFGSESFKTQKSPD